MLYYIVLFILACIFLISGILAFSWMRKYYKQLLSNGKALDLRLDDD